MNDMLFLNEAAQYLRLSEATVRRMVKSKELPFSKLRRKYIFSKKILENYITAPMQGVINETSC